MNNSQKKKKIYKNGKIIYYGNMLNGKRHGYGSLYNSQGHLVYKGEWKLNQKNGAGMEYRNSKIIYQGYFKNNLYDGYGIIYDNNKPKYKGFWKLGNRQGKGIEYYSNGIVSYFGEWKFNQKNGIGKEFTMDGKKVYEGEFLNGQRHGHGTLFKNNVRFYESIWRFGKELELKSFPDYLVPLHKKIGEGGFGILELYENVKNKKLYVVKKMNDERFAKLQYSNLKILKKQKLCRDSFICPFGIYKKKDDSYCIVFDYLEHYKPLSDVNNKNIPLQDKIIISRKLFSDIEKLHKIGIIHGDIKSNNIMIHTKTLDARFIDFGIAIVVDKSTPNKKYRIYGMTEKYFTINKNKKKHGIYSLCKNDINSLYMVLYRFLTGKNNTSIPIYKMKETVDSIL